MFPNIKEALKDLFLSEFNLQDLPEFPYSEYEALQSKYGEEEYWLTGDALSDQPTTSSKVDLYPLRINPLPAVAFKHAAALFGEVENDTRPLVYSKITAPRTADKEKRKKIRENAAQVEELINNIWHYSQGRAIQLQAAIQSQIYGGCVFKVRYFPQGENRIPGLSPTVPVHFDLVHPSSFIGTLDRLNPFLLSEAWIVRTIPASEAAEFGYPNPDPAQSYWWTEHWKKNRYVIRINDRVATLNEAPLGGVNPYGFIPIVYIPHSRITGLYGSGALTGLRGYVKEMNLRAGDYGDAVSDDSHPVLATRNINGSIQVKRVTSWLEVIDLGGRPGLTAHEADPDLFEATTARASESMKKMLDVIWANFCRDAHTPPVSFGEDEGSQRSSLTLTTRFYPLISHINTERWWWGAGIVTLHKMAMNIILKKKLSDIVTVENIEYLQRPVWASMLPKDRELDVNEWTARAGVNLGSIAHLLDLTRDVEDPEEEREAILQDIFDIEAQKAKATAQFGPKPAVPGQDKAKPKQEKKPDDK